MAASFSSPSVEPDRPMLPALHTLNLPGIGNECSSESYGFPMTEVWTRRLNFLLPCHLLIALVRLYRSQDQTKPPPLKHSRDRATVHANTLQPPHPRPRLAFPSRHLHPSSQHGQRPRPRPHPRHRHRSCLRSTTHLNYLVPSPHNQAYITHHPFGRISIRRSTTHLPPLSVLKARVSQHLATPTGFAFVSRSPTLSKTPMRPLSSLHPVLPTLHTSLPFRLSHHRRFLVLTLRHDPHLHLLHPSRKAV